MCDPGIIIWRRTESDEEDFVIILIGQDTDPCSCFFMAQQNGSAVQIFRWPVKNDLIFLIH